MGKMIKGELLGRWTKEKSEELSEKAIQGTGIMDDGRYCYENYP